MGNVVLTRGCVASWPEWGEGASSLGLTPQSTPYYLSQIPSLLCASLFAYKIVMKAVWLAGGYNDFVIHAKCLDNAYCIVNTWQKLVITVNQQNFPGLHLPCCVNNVPEVCPFPLPQAQGHCSEPVQLQSSASFLHQAIMQCPLKRMLVWWCSWEVPSDSD